MRTAHLLAIVTLACPTTLSFIQPALIAHASDKDYVYVAPCIPGHGKSDNNQPAPKPGPAPSPDDHDYFKPGTATYLVAQQLFKIFTDQYGYSGKAASGMLGAISGEAGFVPDAAETTTGVIGHFGMDSKTPPKDFYSGDSGGGGGLFQITPYTKFTNSKFWKMAPGSQGWDPVNQVSFVQDAVFNGTRDVVWWALNNHSTRNPPQMKIRKAEDFFSATDATEACKTWQMGYERGYMYHPDREAVAVKFDSIFNKDDIKADPSKWPNNHHPGPNPGPTPKPKPDNNDAVDPDAHYCDDAIDTKDDDNSNTDILKFARKYTGKFVYGLDHSIAAFKDWDNPPDNAVTDCSGFVWFVLHKTGYKVPANMGWFTKSMETDARGPHQWLKEIKPEEAGPGDIVIVNTGSGSGGDGHTAILTEKWQAGKDIHDNSTGIIQQGGVASHVNEGKFNTSFLSLLSGEVTLARPIKQ